MGSIVGNLLLVLGFSLLFGPAATIDRRSSFTSLGLVAIAVAVALIPAIPAFHGDPERHSIARISIAPAVILLVLYVAVTWRNLRRHRREHVSDEMPEAAGWSLGVSLAVLGAATLVTALIAEILVGSIDTFASNAGLSDFFVAAVIVAIVGNAAEHGGAVVVAHRGNISLAAEIALASAAQVCVFLIPAVALAAWASSRSPFPSGRSSSSPSPGRLRSRRRCSRRDGRPRGAVPCSSLPTPGSRPRRSPWAIASRRERAPRGRGACA